MPEYFNNIKECKKFEKNRNMNRRYNKQKRTYKNKNGKIINSVFKKKEYFLTNSRYKYKHHDKSIFDQIFFTAGDKAQFEEYRDKSNNNPCTTPISLDTNLYRDINFTSRIDWSKYKNLNVLAVSNTFKYIFSKFKKAIFIKIQNNELKVFLPFSNYNFINEWGNKIMINPIYAQFWTEYNQYGEKVLSW